MTRPLTPSYRRHLPPHFLTGPAVEPRPTAQPGAILITSTGVFQVTEAGNTVPRSRSDAVHRRWAQALGVVLARRKLCRWRPRTRWSARAASARACSC